MPELPADVLDTCISCQLKNEKQGSVVLLPPPPHLVKFPLIFLMLLYKCLSKDNLIMLYVVCSVMVS